MPHRPKKKKWGFGRARKTTVQRCGPELSSKHTRRPAWTCSVWRSGATVLVAPSRQSERRGREAGGVPEGGATAEGGAPSGNRVFLCVGGWGGAARPHHAVSQPPSDQSARQSSPGETRREDLSGTPGEGRARVRARVRARAREGARVARMPEPKKLCSPMPIRNAAIELRTDGTKTTGVRHRARYIAFVNRVPARNAQLQPGDWYKPRTGGFNSTMARRKPVHPAVTARTV